MPDSAPKHLLDGYRVLDFTHFIAGPTATRLMAGMGADVVQVELAPRVDEAREVQSIRDKRRAYLIQENRGKQSLCQDMSKPAAVELTTRVTAKFCARAG